MIDKEPQVGVCVLRVEQQANYPLITVTVHRHVGRSLTFAQPALSQQLTDTAEALAVGQAVSGVILMRSATYQFGAVTPQAGVEVSPPPLTSG